MPVRICIAHIAAGVELAHTSSGSCVEVEGGGAEKHAPEVEEKAAPEDEAAVPEKLADDVMKLPRWKRVLYHLFPKLQKSKHEMAMGGMAMGGMPSEAYNWKQCLLFVVELERRVRASDNDYNCQFKYAVSVH